jgi:hypothetical protein
MFNEINVIRELATKYSKPQLANLAQTGQIEPQKAVLAGLMIDRIAKSAMAPPQTTVAQDVLGNQQQQMPPGQMPPGQMPQEQMPQQMAPEEPTQMAASGGVMGMLPYSDGVASLPTNLPDYAEGGIIAFADRGAVKDPYQIEKANFRELDMPVDRTAQTEIARRDEMQKAFGFNPGEFFSKRATEAKAERDKLKTREDEASNKALTKGFLRGAAGKARGNTLSAFLANAAEGAIGGLEAYEGMQKDIREQERLLREIERKDEEAQFLHKRGDVEAAAKRMDESEKAKMEVKAKNAEIFNKSEEARSKGVTEARKTGYEQAEQTKRTGMQTAAQKEIAQMPGDQQKMLMAIQAAEAKKNPDNPPSLLDVHTAVHSNTGKADARARAATAFAEKWNTASADVTGLKLANLKKESGVETVEDFVRKNMEIYDLYYPKGIQRSDAGNQPTGGAATNALPMPADQSSLQKGSVYNTSRGPATWNGTAFVPVQ